MPRFFDVIHIGRPVGQVFDYLTTPANWSQWYAGTLGVSGAVDHPLRLGEQVAEELLVGGQRRRSVWTVREWDGPRSIVLDGVLDRGDRATVTYRLADAPDGTAFERELCFTQAGLLKRLLSRLLVRRVAREGSAALRRLKEVLERAG
jgi:hypothetical protein